MVTEYREPSGRMMSQLFSWGGLGKIQEIEWNTSKSSGEMDVVLVKSKRVKCAPGLRFSDEAAVSVAKQAGWILSWSKIEALISSLQMSPNQPFRKTALCFRDCISHKMLRKNTAYITKKKVSNYQSLKREKHDYFPSFFF